MTGNFTEISENPFVVKMDEVRELSYDSFHDKIKEMLDGGSVHCVAYYGIEDSKGIRLICSVADDIRHNICTLSTLVPKEPGIVKSLTTACPPLHIYEREINENFGIVFDDHPWLKPVRYPHDRKNKLAVMDNYPFYGIESEELHEVGVGPVHAGVIEPGHFRFICNGEKVLHLEIQLGYQHRGVEKLLAESSNSLKRAVICENIAGDSAVAHSIAHAQLIESLGGIETMPDLWIERCIGLELERIAVHIGDTAALCGDVAYQLGQVVCEALRTEIINTTQFWCGNRFGKGLVRPGGTNYSLSKETADKIITVTDIVGKRFAEITDRIYSLPSVLARFEDIGQVTSEQALTIGAVGMAARTCGISRDIRNSHPFQYYRQYDVSPVVLDSGDVLARGMLRVREVEQSVRIIRDLTDRWFKEKKYGRKPVYDYKLKPGSFSLSMVEGWRGEICHSAVTDENGSIVHYKVKDPSFHNWMALALAVRNQEISDFPVCNKSFNLSYCGHDL
ncbi:MAG: NADH-quinone oxidoreductase subunit C [Bacteroidales bacterium]|nr:NADH-quinone oxidoreductase subunit C [Bacteroidales bacterium]